MGRERGYPRLVSTRRDVIAVSLLAVAALAATLAQLAHGGIGPGRTERSALEWSSVLLAVGSVLPVLYARQAGSLAFVACGAISAISAGLGHPVELAAGPTLALFLFAAGRDVPWQRDMTALVGAGFSMLLLAGWLGTSSFPGSLLLHSGLAFALAWFAGDRVRLRREHIAETRALAAAEERARIARDLHDSAGHAVSVIAVRAGAARLRNDPATALAAIGEIEQLARRTASEIDQIVGSLRDRDCPAAAAVEAPAGIASVDTLLANHGAAGLDVMLTREGTARPLAHPVDVAAYRVLQEALANAARHGGGSARVELVYGNDELHLTVANPVGSDTTTRVNGGHGLVGMRERASLLGGRFEASRADGWFRLRATLPYGESQ